MATSGFAHSAFLAGDADLGHWGAIYGVARRGCNREMRVRERSLLPYG